MKRHILIKIIVFIFLITKISSANIRVSGDPAFDSIKAEVTGIDKARIISAAAKYLNEEPVTITAYPAERSAGGLHDFFSEGDYWWPDSTNPDGPYIQRDGMTNPGNFTAHRKAMIRFSIHTAALTAAYAVTSESKYAQQALKHLRAWFVNTATRMHPHLLYAQAIKGRFTGRGIGIIDTIHLIEVAQAVMILAKAGEIGVEELAAIRKWFADYLEWLTTHQYGIDEMNAKNNHGTCWVMQAAQFAKLSGNETIKELCRKRFKEILLPNQMADDGSFPLELKRTKPYNYSLFNLDAFAMICQILSDEKDNLWEYKSPGEKNIKSAIDYMFPFIADKSKWTLPPDVMYSEFYPVRQPSLLFGGIAFNEKKYIELWKTLNPDPANEEVIRNFPVRQPILWLN